MIRPNAPDRRPGPGNGSEVSGEALRPAAVGPSRVAASPRVRLSTLLPLILPIVLAVIAAYVQWITSGLPTVPAITQLTPQTATPPFGFPVWIGITHYVNLLFLVLLVRSGLQVLMDHPRLYWNVHCTPGSEWIRFTPVQVPLDRLYTAKDDARYLTPWVGLPGGRHTLGLARHWHFVSALFWVLNGAVYRVPSVRDEPVAADRAHVLARASPTPGPCSCTTSPSTCRRSRTASISTTLCSNSAISASSSFSRRSRS